MDSWSVRSHMHTVWQKKREPEKGTAKERQRVLYPWVFNLGDYQLLKIPSKVSRVWGKRRKHTPQRPSANCLDCAERNLRSFYASDRDIWHEGQIYFPFHTK